MSFKYTLRKGDIGQEVKRLQSKLPCAADGKFGPKTQAEVRSYQSHNGLTVDGIAGPQTLGRLGIEVYHGIDVSAWNGTVDWPTVAASGVKYAWVKATEGRTHVNRNFVDRANGAKDNNIATGLYHFGRPDSDAGIKDAEREAEHFLNAANKVGFSAGDLIPTLDVEKGMKTDDQYNVEWCLQWLDIIEKELNVKPLVYTARWAYDLFLKRGDSSDLAELLKYPLWVASYNSGTEPERPVRAWDEWTVWQWTGSGSVPGVKGKCDQNWMAGEQLDSLTISATCSNCCCVECTCHR